MYLNSIYKKVFIYIAHSNAKATYAGFALSYSKCSLLGGGGVIIRSWDLMFP